MSLEIIVLTLYFISLSILFFYANHSLVMVYLYKKYKFKKPVWDKSITDNAPFVTIQLPIYNEYYVAQRVIEYACKLDYPKDKLEIQVLDDSTDGTIEITRKVVNEYKSQGYDIVHVHRCDRFGFKSGALRAGLDKAKGDFIAIFDADFIPDTQFLKMTLPHFVDTKVGMVQTRWGHLNENYSWLTKAQAMGLDGHLMIEQTARNRAGFFINFNGTAGIWRKTAILDSGNWQDNTLTEDLDLSFRAQLKGWKSVFLNDIVSPAELPSDINSLKSQQFRWTKGSIETARKLLKEIWKSSLSLKVKIESTIHLTNNIVYVFILLISLLNLPILFLKTVGYDTYFAIMGIFGLAFTGPFFFYLYSQKEIYPDWKGRMLLFPVFMSGSMGLSLNNSKAIFEGLFNRKSDFIRTPKYHIIKPQDNWKGKKYHLSIPWLTFAEMILALYCLAGVVFAFYVQEFAAIPFNIMFFVGYASISILSIKHYRNH